MCYYRDRSRKVSQRPTERNYPPLQSEVFRGRLAATRHQSIVVWTQSEPFAPTENRCPNQVDEPLRAVNLGDAGKDQIDGICNFAGNGTQPLDSDPRGSRKKG